MADVAGSLAGMVEERDRKADVGVRQCGGDG
jgi:hypothetical protein